MLKKNNFYLATVYFDNDVRHQIVAQTKSVCQSWVDESKKKFDGKSSRTKIDTITGPAIVSFEKIKNLGYSNKETAYYAISSDKLVRFKGGADLLSEVTKAARK